MLIGISFESVVEVTRSKFSTNLMTLLTSLGGSVGRPTFLAKLKLQNSNKTQVSSGQTLFWVFLLFISLLQHLSSCMDNAAARMEI